MRIVATLILITVSQMAFGQYWIGPKIGYHYTIHDYQDDNYRDDYNISANHNFELGVAITYTATNRYAVHGELYYEGIGNRVRNKSDFVVDSKSNFYYLSAPILFRITMGHAPVHWYLNGGPKVSLWLGGRGQLANGDLSEFEPNKLDKDGYFNYRVGFKRSAAEGVTNGVYYVNEANRIQYALTVGGGFYMDLANGARMMFDFRYNWGHSNMGFNLSPQDQDGTFIMAGNNTNIPTAGYLENYEYTNNTLSFSVAYMFEYNTDFKRKGSSTSSEAKKTKKSANKKKKD